MVWTELSTPPPIRMSTILPSMRLSGDRTFKEVTKGKRGHKGGALIQ